VDQELAFFSVALRALTGARVRSDLEYSLAFGLKRQPGTRLAWRIVRSGTCSATFLSQHVPLRSLFGTPLSAILLPEVCITGSDGFLL
jgi:hypothetical protein